MLFRSEYFDVPVRSYSSGMQMRVAFSAVTAIRPQILIVDEALSVGDAYFQHKCFARIKKFQEEGTTIDCQGNDHRDISLAVDIAERKDQFTSIAIELGVQV